MERDRETDVWERVKKEKRKIESEAHQQRKR